MSATRITWKHVVAAILIVLVVALAVGVVVWMQGTKEPSAAALAALESVVDHLERGAAFGGGLLLRRAEDVAEAVVRKQIVG